MVILMLLMTAWPAFAEETDGEGQTEEVVITSGQFGPTSTWNYDEETETLYIEGTGGSFEDTGYPWNWQDIWPRKAVIGEGITSIGDSAFEKCKVLTGARIPAGVQYIGYSAFENCSDLKTLKLPEGTGKSGEGIVLEKRIFENCSSLKSVTIPANIRDIPQDMFSGCKKLSRITCRKPLDSIGPYAFEGCPIRKILPTTSKYKLIDTGTYNKCKKLNNVKVPSSVKEISYIAFGECKSLRTITIPASVKVIDDQTFAQGSRDVANVRTIRGAAGSKAQKYAKKHHLRFVKL